MSLSDKEKNFSKILQGRELSLGGTPVAKMPMSQGDMTEGIVREV